jgi:hypothetical protein
VKSSAGLLKAGVPESSTTRLAASRIGSTAFERAVYIQKAQASVAAPTFANTDTMTHSSSSSSSSSRGNKRRHDYQNAPKRAKFYNIEVALCINVHPNVQYPQKV